MKIRIAIVIALGLLLVLGPAAAAQAQCFEPSSIQGQPGSTVTVFSYGDAIYSMTIWFDGAVVAEYGSFHEGESFSMSFTVPATATVGNHQVVINYGGHDHGYCYFTFTVEAATQLPVAPTLPVVAPTSTPPRTLPSTGFSLLPAGGMLAGGLGLLMHRKRR